MNMKLRRWSLLAGPAARLTRLHAARRGDDGGELDVATNRPHQTDCLMDLRSAEYERQSVDSQ